MFWASHLWRHSSAILVRVCALFSLVVLAVSVITSTAWSETLDKDTLRLLLWQAPTTLNPHFADGIKDQTASRIIYEPLASFDREGNLVPFLAAESRRFRTGASPRMASRWFGS